MIIEQFSLNKPSFKYRELTNYGHFGRPDLDLPWEHLDKVDEIKKLLASYL
jgi:S-adenosylmethionine synthetase